MLATIWKWIKIIGLALIGIGAAIIGIKFASGKKTPTPADQDSRVKDNERKEEADRARLDKVDGEIRDAERGIEDTANRTEKEVEKAKEKPDKPGDVAETANEIRDSWKKK